MSSKNGNSVQAQLAARLEQAPDGRAFTFIDAEEKLSWCSYQDFHQAAAARGAILAERGLAKGETCVLILRSSEFCAETVLGCLLIGAPPVLVAPPVVGGLHSNLPVIVDHIIRKTGARVVVIDEEERGLEERLSSARRVRVLVGSESTEGGDASAAPLAFPSPAAIVAQQLTSGTTGFPRVCVWEQRAVLAALDGMERAMELTRDDVFVNWTPLYHDMGLINNFLLCLVKGIPIALLDTFEFVRRPGLWLRALAMTGGTITWSPNFGYAITAQRARDSELEGVRLDHVRGFWNAAERIHLDTFLAFHERFAPLGVRRSALKTNFGCAENVGGATFSDPNGVFLVEHLDRRTLHEQGIAVPVTGAEGNGNVVKVVGVGRPYPGMSIKICSRIGEPLPDGRVGEIALKTPSRMKGYLKDARATRRALKGRLLRTGDFGYLRGDELFWVGRVRERINLHGEKYDPSDFESVLLRVKGLREGCFAAFGVDDARSGTQQLVIMAEVRDSNASSHDATLREVREHVTREIGVTPGDVVLLAKGTMSKTSSGKRRHRFYKNLYLDGDFEAVARLKT